MSDPQKFCSSCQKMRPEASMHKLIRGHTARWICQICRERRNVSPYASKTVQEKQQNERNQ